MKDEPKAPEAAEAARVVAEERREAAELRREESEGNRQLLERIREERQELREVSEAAQVLREESRQAAETVRQTILDALRDTADDLDATSKQMKTVEDMRQALYQLINSPIDKIQ